MTANSTASTNHGARRMSAVVGNPGYGGSESEKL